MHDDRILFAMPPPPDRREVVGCPAPWATALPGRDGLAGLGKAWAAAPVPVALQTVSGPGEEDDDDDDDAGGAGGGGGNIEPDDDEGCDDEDDDEDEEPWQVRAPGDGDRSSLQRSKT